MQKVINVLQLVVLTAILALGVGAFTGHVLVTPVKQDVVLVDDKGEPIMKIGENLIGYGLRIVR